MGALAVALLAAACAGEKPSGGGVQVRVDAVTYRHEITRIALEVQPAGVLQDLAYDAYSGSFAGSLSVPVGLQTLTATAWAGDRQVGVGTAAVEIVAGARAYVAITIYDTTGPPPAPDHAPVITSFVVPTLTPTVDEPITLSASALDPDGTPVTYEWTQSCATGTLSDPSSPVTQWTGAAAGACTLTLVASSNGLSDVASAAVYAIDPGTGVLEVGGAYVSHPTMQSVSVSTSSSYRNVHRLQSDVDAGVVPLGESVNVSLAFDLGTYSPGAFLASLSDSCGGSAVLQYVYNGYASFAWTPPAAPAACVLTAAVEHAGLRDAMPIVLTVAPCSPAVQCGPSAACSEGVCQRARTIWGRMQTTYWDGNTATVTQASPEVGYVDVQALVPVPGGFASYPGFMDFTGTFNIGGVPSGRYLLAITMTGGGFSWVIDTRSDYVDVGGDELGRPYKTTSSGPTPVTIQASGLEPWAFGDQLQLTSIGAGVWDVASERWDIPEGASEVEQTEDWLNNLVDASLGDVLYVHQLAQRDAPSLPGVPYLTAVGAQALSVSVADLVPTTIAAALAPVEQTGRLDASWATSAFEAYLPDMGPAGTVASGHSMWIDATPGSLGYPAPNPAGGWPDLLYWEVPAGTADFATGAVPYGQFLPEWNEFRFTGFSSATFFTAAGAATPRSIITTLGVYDAANVAEAAPRISPVRAPAIAGLDLTGGEVAGAGTAPVLSWSAPATGPADYYFIGIYELYVRAGGATGARLLGYVYTGNTSVPLPFTFTSGMQYYARIYAYADPSSDVESAPYRGALAGTAFASRVTAPWTP